MITMNGKYRLALIVVATMLLSASIGPAKADVSFRAFHSNLSAHGTWHVSAEYGQVWQPGIYRSGWNPYYEIGRAHV